MSVCEGRGKGRKEGGRTKEGGRKEGRRQDEGGREKGREERGEREGEGVKGEEGCVNMPGGSKHQ